MILLHWSEVRKPENIFEFNMEWTPNKYAIVNTNHGMANVFFESLLTLEGFRTHHNLIFDIWIGENGIIILKEKNCMIIKIKRRNCVATNPQRYLISITTVLTSNLSIVSMTSMILNLSQSLLRLSWDFMVLWRLQVYCHYRFKYNWRKSQSCRNWISK